MEHKIKWRTGTEALGESIGTGAARRKDQDTGGLDKVYLQVVVQSD